jgi:phosphoethanolamine N-methyltransferase
LREVSQYGQIFTDLDFSKVQAVDVTNVFVASLEAELKKMEQIKNSFVSEFSLKDFNYLVEGWNAKLVRCANNEQKWGLFYCEK